MISLLVYSFDCRCNVIFVCYYNASEAGIVFVGVCLFVCLSARAITKMLLNQKLVRLSI